MGKSNESIRNERCKMTTIQIILIISFILAIVKTFILDG